LKNVFIKDKELFYTPIPTVRDRGVFSLNLITQNALKRAF